MTLFEETRTYAPIENGRKVSFLIQLLGGAQQQLDFVRDPQSVTSRQATPFARFTFVTGWIQPKADEFILANRVGDSRELSYRCAPQRCDAIESCTKSANLVGRYGTHVLGCEVEGLMIEIKCQPFSALPLNMDVLGEHLKESL
jgi:hypothetical protein